jgi:hypothetical protein
VLWQTAFAIPIVGSASGHFQGGGVQYQGLTYASNPAIGGDVFHDDPLELVLGSFTLTGNAADYVRNFVLTINFTSPVTLQEFTATVLGEVEAVGDKVYIGFTNENPRVFFADNQRFTLSVDPLTVITAGVGPVNLNGTLSVPEPAAFEALAAGLVGVVLLLRRRSVGLGGLLAR